MRGLCPVCRQPTEVIESCVDTLGIHYVIRGDVSQVCLGSGRLFNEYLEDTVEND